MGGLGPYVGPVFERKALDHLPTPDDLRPVTKHLYNISLTFLDL